MADKISATITYVDANNKKGTKAITDISPSAPNIAIKNFCVAINALSTNTISSIEKIERTNIMDSSLEDPQFSVSPTTYRGSSIDIGSPAVFTLSYLGNVRNVTLSGQKTLGSTYSFDGKTLTFSIDEGGAPVSPGSTSATLTLELAADDSYNSATATITWTGVGDNGFINV